MSTHSYKDLLAQREALEQQIAAARKTEVADAVQKIKGLIEAFGLTQDDVFPAAKQKQKRETGSVAPKYRDPATGQTWSGRGKPPNWIKDQDRSQFEI
ncbi:MULTISPECIES: H-NS histone family protein [Comamonas]|jgi:DNA-binding protein H-NS|uniref:H-NS histone family n=1 Tax=Comamonas testosteroni TaxID=285 RepID=A0A8B4S7I0_COMTE|nr:MULTISPECIES: H-NS histone family protein [Comamonas]EHN65725.1 histone-like nucleoid-structuring protein H-NS [Comamonas testosteroni ATCC 11996]QQN68484.1 H-NS histone family protein [Comamonas testosteroni]RDI10769.1 nucleoid protein H-NS [Comamonas sp. AG1104]SUY78250.1 H-NS histone family [Comamonas testosteroni]